MDDVDSSVPPYSIPERIFRAGEEPTGVRVTPYHKPDGIKKILNVLEPEEIEAIRGSPFGKLVDLAEKPSFSGRFGRYIISRQLKVAKKYEAWFEFAGKPIRFSLREFAIVTGLNCDKFTKRSKKKLANRTVSSKPYWVELFGTLKEVPVSSVIRMLKSKAVTNPELRMKYAYLALLSSVILPTTHTPKISEDYAEMIKDIDQFFLYPWGRVAFGMLISSIKERKEVSLAQNTIALKGFVLALQLVMVQAVPALTEVVRDGSSSGSEDDYRADEDIVDDEGDVRKSISPGHARDIDAAGKAVVHSIIHSELLPVNDNTLCVWSDDEDDPAVDNLVKLIHEGYPFTHSSFVGGVTKLDVMRMREETKQSLNRKPGKRKRDSGPQMPGVLDVDGVVTVVKDSLKEDFSRLEAQLATFRDTNISFQTQVLSQLSQMFSKVEECAVNIGALSHVTDRVHGVQKPASRPSVSNAATQTNTSFENIDGVAGHEKQLFRNHSRGPLLREEHGGEKQGGESTTGCDAGGEINDGTRQDRDVRPSPLPPRGRAAADSSSDASLDPDLLFPDPSFSLGLTQEERAGLDKVVTGCINAVKQGAAVPRSEDIQLEKEEVGIGCRKSKRAKNPPKSLLGNYECDKRFLNLGRQAFPESYLLRGDIDFSAKFSILEDKWQTPFSIVNDGWTLDSNELRQIVDRSTPTSAKVVDALMSHISVLWRCNSPPNQHCTSIFMASNVVDELLKAYPDFSEMTKKESFHFPDSVQPDGEQKAQFLKAERFYCPFNIENKYWVGLCVDMSSWAICVLDSNVSVKSDYMMSKAVKPLAQMFPYFANQLGKPVASKDGKPMSIARPRTLPQSNTLLDSALAALLFIQAHAVGGFDACKTISADVFDTEVERLAVTLYEGNVGPL